MQCQRSFRARIAEEKRVRLVLIHSFGALSTGAAPGAAESVFSVRATKSFARIADLRPVFYDLGYWLGAEYDFARASLDGAGTGEFSFRDLVAWWAQSARAFLMLLDDAAFKARHACVCGVCVVLLFRGCCAELRAAVAVRRRCFCATIRCAPGKSLARS